MEETRQIIDYAIWVIIVGLTLGFFSYFSKRYQSLGRLIVFVLIPTWIITALVKGLEYLYIDNSYNFLTLWEFSMLLAETLPVLIIFGGITFTVKYLKQKRQKNI